MPSEYQKEKKEKKKRSEARQLGITSEQYLIQQRQRAKDSFEQLLQQQQQWSFSFYLDSSLR